MTEPRYIAGESDVFDDQDGAAVFDTMHDDEVFCLIPPTELCGKEGALARAKDIANLFNAAHEAHRAGNDMLKLEPLP